MGEFVFDVKLFAVFTVHADDAGQALAQLVAALEAAEVHAAHLVADASPDGDPDLIQTETPE